MIPEVPPKLRNKVLGKIRNAGSNGIPERDLADQFGGRLHNIQDALMQLEHDNVIKRRRGRCFIL